MVYDADRIMVYHHLMKPLAYFMNFGPSAST